MELLKFSKGNAKLKGIPSLSLLAGWSCPQANLCKAKVNLVTKKLEDGPEQVYRCFSASQEVLFKEVFNQRKHNFDLLRSLKTADEMAALIQASLPNPKKKIIRLHVSGDIFNEQYYLALVKVAENNPNLLFYTYTKSLAIWVKYKDITPSNFKLTASKGGRQDHLIEEYNLKYVQVVSTPEEAELLGLPLDKDDSNAYMHDKPFALLIHGTQKAGSDMSKAKSALRKRGITGYQRISKTPNKFKKLIAA